MRKLQKLDNLDKARHGQWRYDELHDKAKERFLNTTPFFPSDWLEGEEQAEFKQLDHLLYAECTDGRCWCVNG